MRRPARLALVAVSALLGFVSLRAQPGTLDITFIDTEGGQATLVVAPSGQTMLVDTGFAGRDAERIAAVLTRRGIGVLDVVVITHYHGDHVGGAAELAARVPIRHFVDHGPYTVELQPSRSAGFLAYAAVRERARTIVPAPGDRLPLDGVDVRVVASAGRLLATPLPGAPGTGAANAFCLDAVLKTPDPTPENQESLGLVITFGAFRLLDLGDLTWNQEHRLACPANLLGTIDVLHTTRHGDPNSGAPQLVHALGARVAVMNNGETKGGHPAHWDTVRRAPGLQDLWQLHRSAAGGTTHNSEDGLVANLTSTDHGYPLTLAAATDGSFRMTNGRTGGVREYPRRAAR